MFPYSPYTVCLSYRIVCNLTMEPVVVTLLKRKQNQTAAQHSDKSLEKLKEYHEKIVLDRLQMIRKNVNDNNKLNSF